MDAESLDEETLQALLLADHLKKTLKEIGALSLDEIRTWFAFFEYVKKISKANNHE